MRRYLAFVVMGDADGESWPEDAFLGDFDVMRSMLDYAETRLKVGMSLNILDTETRLWSFVTRTRRHKGLPWEWDRRADKLAAHPG